MSAFEIVWGDLRADIINKADAFRRVPASRFEEIMQDFRGLPRNMIQGPKWTGGKRQPYYIGPLRRAMALNPSKRGGRRRIVEPFMGALNVSANVNPGQRALAGDFDDMMPEVFKRIQQGDMTLDMKPFLQDGNIDRRTFYEDIRGATPKGRKGKDFDSRFETLKPDSLNDFIRRQKEGGLTDQEFRDMIERFAQYQRMAWRGEPRRSGLGYANMTINNPSFSLPPTLDLATNQPAYANFDIHGGMDYKDFFKLPINPDDDFGFIDPPYAGGEGANYDFPVPDPMEEHKILAELVGDLAAEGMPIVATNNPIVAPLYEKHGFKTQLMGRPDRYRNYGGAATLKPEAIMHNLDDFDFLEGFDEMRY